MRNEERGTRNEEGREIGDTSFVIDMKPEIEIIDDFVSNSDDLFRYLCKEVDWDERLKSRKTASYGVAYNYSGMAYPETEMLKELIPICEKIDFQIGFMPNNCLLNYYPDGNSTMGYHSDNWEQLEQNTGVVIISLGASRIISYRNKKDKAIERKYTLNCGNMLYMSNSVQEQWMHAIPKQSQAEARISLTFRKIK